MNARLASSLRVKLIFFFLSGESVLGTFDSTGEIDKGRADVFLRTRTDCWEGATGFSSS